MMAKRSDGVRSIAGNASGFTLLELLVALVLVAVFAMAAQPLLRGSTRDKTFDAIVRDIARQLRTTRLDAIRTNADAAFVIDFARRAYATPGRGGIRLLPAGLEIAAIVDPFDPPGRTAFTVQFYPDGSTSGGGIRLRVGARHAKIMVDGLTGHVQTQLGHMP